MTDTLLPTGVLIDHNRPVDELNAMTVELAIGYGYEPHDDDHRALQLFFAGQEWVATDLLTVSEALGWAADDAAEWLNDNVCPEGFHVANDGEAGALGVWANDRYTNPEQEC